MSHYIRYVITEDKAVSLPELDRVLRTIHDDYKIDGTLILVKDEIIGQIEINKKRGVLFKGDLESLHDFAERKERHQFLKDELRKAKSIVTVQVVWSLGNNGTLEALEPLFEWLLSHRSGILVAEGGYFSNQDGLVL